MLNFNRMGSKGRTRHRLPANCKIVSESLLAAGVTTLAQISLRGRQEATYLLRSPCGDFFRDQVLVLTSTKIRFEDGSVLSEGGDGCDEDFDHTLDVDEFVTAVDQRGRRN